MLWFTMLLALYMLQGKLNFYGRSHSFIKSGLSFVADLNLFDSLVSLLAIVV